MKKIMLLLMAMVMVAGVMVSCAGEVEPTEEEKFISEVTYDVLVGDCDNFTASIYVGKREEVISLDGICGAMRDYFVIRIIPIIDGDNATDDSISTIEYNLKTTNKTYNGILPLSSSKRGYTEDLKQIISDEKTMEIEVIMGEVTSVINITSVLDTGMQTWENVHEKLLIKTAEKIQELTVDDVFNGEIIIRLISDSSSSDCNYFWYCTIIDSECKLHSQLLDAKSGEWV